MTTHQEPFSVGQRQQYLADIARLREQKKRLPMVTEEFMLDVASMSREELQRRCMIGSDWIGHFAASLDGIPEIRCMPGAGIDGCRNHDSVRAIVLRLVKECPLTFEKTWQGEPKIEPINQREGGEKDGD